MNAPRKLRTARNVDGMLSLAIAEEQSSPLRSFVRSESSVCLSSSSLPWRTAQLERHFVPPTEWPEGSIDCVLLILWHGRDVARGEHRDSGEGYLPYAKRPGTLTLFVPGMVPAIRSTTETDFLLCALRKDFISGLSEQLQTEGPPRRSLGMEGLSTSKHSFQDAALRQLLLLLEHEVKLKGISGPLYADHLAHAIGMRLLASSCRHTSKQRSRVALPTRFLGQLVERIEANPVQRFDLAHLAAQYGYSYSRFVRDFRASTGYSPHRYITRQRLERAKQLMRKRSLTLLEVALETGFASHAHFTHAFRQHFGCAPSRFRIAP